MFGTSKSRTIAEIVEEECTEEFLDHLVTHPASYGHRAWEILRDLRRIVDT